MMPRRILAKQVTEAMEDANPARLIDLAESGKLVPFLEERIQAFKQQFVREMEGKPPQAELTVIEGLMPMLTEFRTAKERPTLTQRQKAQVEQALDHYETTSYRNSPVEYHGLTSV